MIFFMASVFAFYRIIFLTFIQFVVIIIPRSFSV